MNNTQNDWSEVISPKSSLFDLRLNDVWRYRDLLLLFVKRDFVATYKQTILGPTWHFIQPIFTTAIFLFIFTGVAKIPTDGVPPVLFYMCGIGIWNYFSVCFTSTANTFVANAGIFGKVYFPRLVLPLSVVMSNLIKFGIQLSLIAVVFGYQVLVKGYEPKTNAAILLLPVFVVLMALLGLGMGIIVSSLTTKYRDFTHLIGFGVQLLMYLTPVAYPLSFVQNKSYGHLLAYNPIAPIVEGFRYAVTGAGSFTPGMLVYSIVSTVVILFVGIVLFNKVEKSFMDTV
ncbi:MAG: ABC transporter permease [Bacteroidetes bacterium]|nr:MAG: ABC transporter permease [Bacteroidota bacterium]TAE60129.1 MAG: ABC transporter permease [Bacteroidota bacterium]